MSDFFLLFADRIPCTECLIVIRAQNDFQIFSVFIHHADDIFFGLKARLTYWLFFHFFLNFFIGLRSAGVLRFCLRFRPVCHSLFFLWLLRRFCSRFFSCFIRSFLSALLSIPLTGLVFPVCQDIDRIAALIESFQSLLIDQVTGTNAVFSKDDQTDLLITVLIDRLRLCRIQDVCSLLGCLFAGSPHIYRLDSFFLPALQFLLVRTGAEKHDRYFRFGSRIRDRRYRRCIRISNEQDMASRGDLPAGSCLQLLSRLI